MRSEGRLLTQPVGDVDDEGDDEVLIADTEGAQADFHRQFGSVLPAHREIHAFSHRPVDGFFKITFAMFRVMIPEALRNKCFHLHAFQLLFGVAEFVGRLFHDLLDGKTKIRVADAKSDHPLAFE